VSKTYFNDGVYDISNDEYHGSDGISRSKLMLLDKSPYHFWYEAISGKAQKKEPTPSMIIGSLFHTLLLEPDKFDSEYILSPRIDRRTTKGKEDWEIFQSCIGKRTVITDEYFDKAKTMAEQIREHEIVQTLLDEALFEKSIFWTDKETGLQFKTRPDIWSSKMVVDLKTTCDANSFNFSRSALNYGYFIQAGMAYEGCKALGKPFDMFVILACEKEAPHVPAVFMMDDEALKFGVEQFNTYKRKLKACFDSGKWPGYSVQELSIPKYATLTEEKE